MKISEAIGRDSIWMVGFGIFCYLLIFFERHVKMDVESRFAKEIQPNFTKTPIILDINWSIYPS